MFDFYLKMHGVEIFHKMLALFYSAFNMRFVIRALAMEPSCSCLVPRDVINAGLMNSVCAIMCGNMAVLRLVAYRYTDICIPLLPFMAVPARPITVSGVTSSP